MLPVNSLDQAIENISRYQTEIQESPELAGRMRFVRAWYAIGDGTWLFAPSKFIGYTKNTADAYLLKAGNEIDGRDTERILQEWFAPADRTAELDEALQKFLQSRGHSAPNAKARICVLKESGRERPIDASIDPELRKRIHSDAAICGGRPLIRGTRIRVCDILGMLANGVSASEMLADYPYLTEADLRAALAFGAAATERPAVIAS